MFNLCNRANAHLPGTLFNQCKYIENIYCFAGETGLNTTTAVSLSTFPDDIFKPYDANQNTGQINIKNVGCAFRNNNHISSGTGTAIDFWNWKYKPTTFAGCYHNCNVSNIDSVPIEYKTSA